MSRAAIIADKYIARDGGEPLSKSASAKKPLMTTLNRIHTFLSRDDLEELLIYLNKTKPDDVPLAYATILESIGIDKAIYCCRAEPQYDREWRQFALWCAREVEHLMQDQHSLDALNVAEKYINGHASEEDLTTARYLADAAALMTAARDADFGRGRTAASAAADTAKAVVDDYADDAAHDAANASAVVVYLAYGSAHFYAAREAQSAKFREIVGKP